MREPYSCSVCGKGLQWVEVWVCKTCKAPVCHEDLAKHKCQGGSQSKEPSQDLDEEVSGSEADDALEEDFED